MKIKAIVMFVLFFLSVQMSADPQDNNSNKQELKALIEKSRDLISEGKYEIATKYCKKALTIRPDFYQIYNLLGYIYVEKEEDKRHAISYFLKSLSILDRQPDIYYEVGLLYKSIGKTDEAAANFEKGLEYSPEDFGLNYQMGLIYLTKKNDPQKASEYFLEARKANPEDAKVLFVTGISFILADKEAEVLEYITTLRERKEELYATRLEEALRERQEKRETEEKAKTDLEEMQKERELYIQQMEAAKTAPAAGSGSKPTLSIGAPSTSTKARGEITVHRTYKAKGTVVGEVNTEY